jgi:serine/threonine-protein kinase RsbW
LSKITNHSLELHNDLSELKRMSAWIYQTGKLMELPQALAFELDLCATEAVTNIITYAYDGAASHRIRLRLGQALSRVNIEIEDDGKPFNPLEFPPAPPVSSVEDAPLGGRGIHLIRSLMTECKYHRRDGKNIFTMVSRQRPPLE